MRHVLRTYRVALEGLFDRINLDSKIQIKYVDTKNQPADMVTKGCFTRDQWNHLLRLLSVVNFLMFSCNRVFLHMKQSPMSKKKSGRYCQGRFGNDKPETY